MKNTATRMADTMSVNGKDTEEQQGAVPTIEEASTSGPEEAGSGNQPNAVAQMLASAATKSSSSDSSTTKPRKSGMPIETQIETAQNHKDQGNKLYASGDVKGAMTQWHFALLHSSGLNSCARDYDNQVTEDHVKRAQAVTIAARNNLASCYLNDEKWEKVIVATTQVLSMDSKNIKAYYRRAKAHLKMGHIQKAANDVDQAMNIDGNDPGVTALANEIVAIEERKLAESRKKLGGFLKGRILAPDGSMIGEIEVTEPPEDGATQTSQPIAAGHQCGPEQHEHDHQEASIKEL